MNEWTEILDNCGMDFMKACVYGLHEGIFDKVPHKKLIKQMERYGINNKI